MIGRSRPGEDNMNDSLNILDTNPGIRVNTSSDAVEIGIGAFTAIAIDVDGVTFCNLRGRLTATAQSDEVDELSGLDRLVAKLRERTNRQIVVNLMKLTMMDSTAERQLEKMKALLAKAGSEVVLVGLQFGSSTTATRLAEVFEVFPTDSHAIAYFRSERQVV
jgi:anti-anti-sigma regulatory factor